MGLPPGSTAPQRLRIRPGVRYRREEVYEICAALALAEVLLARDGHGLEAARMGAAFSLAEAGLTR